MALNALLAEKILALPDTAYLQRSHFFHGRYENLYLSRDALPGLEQILTTAQQQAAKLLNCVAADLKTGFWLNIMHQGDITTLHSHDDDDELLSAVYYVQVPPGSAIFQLHLAGQVESVEPVAGRFMFFDPALPHEVTVHEADEARISIGMNFGPVSENE